MRLRVNHGIENYDLEYGVVSVISQNRDNVDNFCNDMEKPFHFAVRNGSINSTKNCT